MNIEPLPISGAYLISLNPIVDDRGYFVRSVDYQMLAKAGLTTQWLQENQSYSKRPFTIRGLHFQRPPAAETKLIQVVKGRLFDVLLDLRRSSTTYGQWFGMTLSEWSHQMLYIPRGCAHGFCTLEADTVIQYKVDTVYTPQLEGGIDYRDPTIAIDWPIPLGSSVIQSSKDKEGLRWSEFESPFV